MRAVVVVVFEVSTEVTERSTRIGIRSSTSTLSDDSRGVDNGLRNTDQFRDIHITASLDAPNSAKPVREAATGDIIAIDETLKFVLETKSIDIEFTIRNSDRRLGVI